MHGETVSAPAGISGWQALWQEYSTKIPLPKIGLPGANGSSGKEESAETQES